MDQKVGVDISHMNVQRAETTLGLSFTNILKTQCITYNVILFIFLVFIIVNLNIFHIDYSPFTGKLYNIEYPGL